MTNRQIIDVTDVHKSYSMGASEVKVLKGVNLRVNSGEYVAIVGASGSGKSTLLHIIGALDKPDSGELKFKDQRINKLRTRKLNTYRNKTVGFVFQFYHLLDELTVVENVILPTMASRSVLGWFQIKKKTYQKASDLLQRLGLGDRLRHKPYQLSGGERQRTAIARALINDPEILLADEPTGNLDSETGNGILEVFEDLNRAGQTIVLVTHDKKTADSARREVILKDGVIQ